VPNKVVPNIVNNVSFNNNKWNIESIITTVLTKKPTLSHSFYLDYLIMTTIVTKKRKVYKIPTASYIILHESDNM
jgi:hypothetical protein